MNSNVIIAEGDSGIAVMFCGNCGEQFRAYMHSVTCANKQPICSKCIEYYNPLREAKGMAPMPYNKSAYLSMEK